jgi:aspartokinase-like uncharacterized kinase
MSDACPLGSIQSLRVVKVGGSLFDMPDLGARLRSWLGGARTLLVPGGGATADAIRNLDRVHRLGEEAAHWLALHALSVNAQFLARMLDVQVTSRIWDPAAEAICVLDPLPFFREDERSADRLPHTWRVTSDSLAARIAVCAAACELVLLKSVSWRVHDGWPAAVAADVVDTHFPVVLQQAPALPVRIVNFRQRDAGLTG